MRLKRLIKILQDLEENFLPSNTVVQFKYIDIFKPYGNETTHVGTLKECYESKGDQDSEVWINYSVLENQEDLIEDNGEDSRFHSTMEEACTDDDVPF